MDELISYTHMPVQLFEYQKSQKKIKIDEQKPANYIFLELLCTNISLDVWLKQLERYIYSFKSPYSV